MIEVAIAGAAGRMGRTLVEAVETSGASIKVGAASVLADDPTVGSDIGLLALGRPLGVVAEPSLESQVDAFGVLIDFTSPEATLGYLALCCRYDKAMVIGTTGFKPENLAAIDAAAPKRHQEVTHELRRYGEARGHVASPDCIAPWQHGVKSLPHR